MAAKDSSTTLPGETPPAPPPPPTEPRPTGAQAEASGAGLTRLFAQLFDGMSGWLVSLCLHFVLILVFALWSLPSLPQLDLPKLLASTSDEVEGVDEIPLLDFDDADLAADLDTVELEDTSADLAAMIAESFEPTSAPVFTPLADSGLTAAITGDALSTPGGGVTESYSRGATSRSESVRRNGGSDASEAAVRMALEWLARHQNPDGSWSLRHDLGPCRGRCGDPSQSDRPGGPDRAASLRAATGLALLPFLGAGQTHQVGKHKRVIARGLKALVAMGQPNKKGPGRSWSDSAGRMYSHGIAAIVLTEAYGMTGDAALATPAQAALDYITFAQGPDGGWRYRPGQIGDTSVTGWQVMALKSGYLAKLRVPELTAKRAYGFFDTVQHNGGARYAYVAEPEEEGKPPKPTNTRSAVGLLGRMYLGWANDRPALVEGVRRLAQAGPSEKNVYYNYYAAQVLFQYTSGEGQAWREWNTELREQLIEQQSLRGHERGSWFVGGPHSDKGGRLYQTSLATMTLEVYYRYLPIYKLDTGSIEFPE